jgi:hypothetical protein
MRLPRVLRGSRGDFGMRILYRTALACAALTLAQSPASAGGGVTVHIQNDTVDNLSVSIYDRNLGRRQPVVSSQVINGNASISITITANTAGQGHLSWTATTLDADMRRCGRHDSAGLNDGDTVHVRADTACPAHRHR